MSRTNRSQSDHDKRVAEIADKYREQRYSVWADVPGYIEPLPINSHIPDVVARNGFERIIIEVETEDSVDSDRAESQREAFQNKADDYDLTTFKQVIV